MKRNYFTMRRILEIAKASDEPLTFMDFNRYQFDGPIDGELTRLKDDGLIVSTIKFGGTGAYMGGEVSGLTGEGRAFFKVIENPEVWDIIIETLDKADIDISYPLLKEVCEEIVKRYVMRCIPDMEDVR